MLAGFAGFSLVQQKAHAADFYTATLAPGADAGSLALVSITGGNQYMVRCSNYSVTYKLCMTGLTCSATANDSPIDADQSIDVCGVTGWTQISVFRTYDGGVPSCRLYSVNPSSPACRQ